MLYKCEDETVESRYTRWTRGRGAGSRVRSQATRQRLKGACEGKAVCKLHIL